MQNDSLYNYIRKMVFPDDTEIKLDKDAQEKIHINLFNNLRCFPHFPDIQLITDLSCENYERKVCVVNLVFFPFQSDINPLLFSFLYDDEKICFDDSNRRLIRKISESVDEEHALILVYDYNNNSYYIRGIANKSNVDDFFNNYYFIKISGYLSWSANCKKFNLFCYDKGEFWDFDHSNLDKQIDKVLFSFKSIFSESLINDFGKLLRLIVDQNHGTSLVVFNSIDVARNETVRLCNAGRGFAAKNIIPYNELLECIPQFTKVDGGLIFDKNLNCYAYGCIYDGCVDNSFMGSQARGSRYNSTKLYVHSLNKNNLSTCYGVVFSDDGGVECVT